MLIVINLIKYYNDLFDEKKHKKIKLKLQLKSTLKRNVLIFYLTALSSQRVRKLTGMEFHILGAACEKALNHRF